MTEAELISKIQKLKQIKPSKSWVVLTKSQILGADEEPKSSLAPFGEVFSRFIFQYKPVLATLVIFGILISSAFIWAQNSLPGDILYSFKRISEKGQAVFVSDNDKPKISLELTNKRLEELTEIAQTNQVKKLAPAIEEVQASMAEAVKSLKKSTKLEKGFVVQTQKLEENKQKIEALGIVVEDDEELDNTLSQLVEREIKDLESGTLTESQKELLETAKENFEAGDYSQALEKILFLSYPQE